jgi:hypothetical protein
MQFIRNHWSGLLGLVSLLWGPIQRATKWLLRWAGDFDLVISRAQDPDWIAVVIRWLLDPPGWVILPALIAGVVLIIWDFRRHSRKIAMAGPNRFGQVTLAQANAKISPPHGIVTASDTTPRGAKLITLGQFIIIGSGIVAIIGLLIGAALILIGDRQNATPPEATRAIRESPTAPVVQSTPPPVAAPILQSPPTPVVPSPAITPEPSIPKPKIEVPAPPPKEFVDAHVTLEFLVGLYEGQTTLGAETLASKYKGKWMPVSGPLLETVGGYPFLQGRTPVVASLERQQGPSVILVFHNEWIDRLAMIPKNKIISVHGQIEDIGRSKVVLNPCELVDEPDPKTNTPTQSPNASTRPRRRRSSKREPR